MLIQDPPHFRSLYEMKQKAEEVIGMIDALSEGGDIPNRASDLMISVENLSDCVKSYCTEEDEK
jgi:hypothetical protein